MIWFTSVLGTHRRGRSDDEDGFSIVELLASLTVLAIGIVALLGTLVVAARAAGTQRGRINAVFAANRAFEDVRARPYNQIALWQNDPNFALRPLSSTATETVTTDTAQYAVPVRREPIVLAGVSYQIFQNILCASHRHTDRPKVFESLQIGSSQGLVVGPRGQSPDTADSRQGGEPVCPPQEPILGAAGQLRCSSTAWAEIPMVIFPPDGQQFRCGVEGGNVQRAPAPFTVDQQQPPPSAQPLPSCGSINATCTLSPADFAALQGGVTYRVQNLTLGSSTDQSLCSAANISQSNPVVIYVTGSLTIQGGALINVRDSGNTQGCINRPFVGPVIDGWGPTTQPGGLRIVRTCPSNPQAIDVGSGSHIPRASMVLDAMCSIVVVNGGPHFYLFGAALLDQYTDNGSLRVLAYDRQLAQITTRKFRIKDWREIPPVPDPTTAP
ncbi:MAG: hypothetical protein C4319_06140 [Acidimicrobiia bacterium]